MNTKTNKLTKPERHKLIIGKLRESPAIRVSELSNEIGVSTETIRRDLDELESQGLISRTYGGAAPALNREPSFKQRELLNAKSYELIAQAACHFVQNGEVISIGSSVTTLQVAIRLAAEKSDLTVFTDSYVIASALASNPTFKVHVCPGLYSDTENCVFGPESINYFLNIYAQKAILGASGINIDGVSNVDIDIAETYKIMSRRASETIIVADHTKISRDAISTYLNWNQISRLIIDEAPYDEELITGLRRGNVTVTVASDSSWSF
ncbi:MAG: DeoR/GlpR family DNA-binding transcription regulator [Succinivibrio sp.]